MKVSPIAPHNAFDEQNPYRAPADETGLPTSGNERRKPVFRWRTIPAGIFAFSGIAEFTGGVSALFLSILAFAFASRPHDWYATLVASPVMIVAGALWIKASQAWLRGKWRFATIFTLLGYAINAILPAMFARR
jgi:hypothetical protein